MYVVSKLIVSALVALIAYISFIVFANSSLEAPVLEEIWWGPGERIHDEKPVLTPFSISVSESLLQDLKYRLDHTRPFTPSLEQANQRYGIHFNFLNKILKYWKQEYNWREREKFLNQYSHFKLKIQGLNIHFLHVKPKTTCGKKAGSCRVKVLPLMILHGFYGSFREFYEMVPILTTPQEGKDFVFELVIPSLPGFGFSDGAVRPGLSDHHMAVILNNLMKVLGFKKYYLQGGDWGAKVAENIAKLYPENVIGVHLNFCNVKTVQALFREIIGQIFPSLIYTEKEKKLCFSEANTLNYILEESGYFHFQSTKPDTIGVALNDSPMGLASYFIEKFTTLTNPAWRDTEEGGLLEKITLEKLLDDIMIYYISGSITTAMRIYAECFTQRNLQKRMEACPVLVPSACARFPNEIFLTPRSILNLKYQNLVQLTDFEDGGHFAAFELPEVLAKDIFDFVHKLRES